METTNFEISQELQQMREQFKILTEKVEKQNIIREKQLRLSMRRRIKSYDFWETWIQIIILFVSCPILYFGLIERAGMSDWSVLMLIAYCIIGIAYLLVKKLLQDKLLDYNGDLKLFATNLKTVKKWHFRTILISLPVALTFITLFSIDYFNAISKTKIINQENLVVTIVCMIVVMAVSIFVSTRKRSILDNIISDIEE